MTTKFKKTYFARAFLRRPGQSNQVGIGLGTLGMGFFSGLMAMSALSAIAADTGYYQNVFFTVAVGSVFCMYASWRFVYRYLQGLEGEKRVYDELVPIIQKGYYVLSSFPGDKFDVDFVVVGPAGIFAVEVKNPTRYSPEDRIVFKNGLLFLHSKEIRRPKAFRWWNPIKQVRENSRWLERNLTGVVKGKTFKVKGVVAFPDMWVDEYQEPDLMVLNPARFVTDHLPKLPKVLEPHEVGTILRELRSHVRESETAVMANL